VLAFKRLLQHSAVVLLVASVIACPLFALEKSPLAAPLALGMNVSAPLIELNDLVQGSPSDSFNFRNGTSLEVGLDHVQRDSTVLGVMVTITVLAHKFWLRHRRHLRRKRRETG
jgi:hypothetical protein